MIYEWLMQQHIKKKTVPKVTNTIKNKNQFDYINNPSRPSFHQT